MPLSIDIKKALIFGGERGEGLQKTQKLALFADEILVIPEGEAPGEILVERGYPSELKEKLYLDQDRVVPVHSQRADAVELEALLQPGPGVFVVSDLTSRVRNEEISRLCQERGILCNIIDTKDLCTVWFMSLIQTPHLSVALSTRGGAAYYSARMREEWQGDVENREPVAQLLGLIRERVPRGQDRYTLLDLVYRDKKFQKWIKKQKWKQARLRAWELAKGGGYELGTIPE